MVVGSMELDIRLDGCHSLKDKRRVLRSVMDRVRHEFNVAIAEVADHELWGNACIGVACVSNDPRHAESVLQSVVASFDDYATMSVDSVSRRIERS